MITKFAIRFLRQTEGLTQKQFAEKVGISEGLLNNIESGYKRVSKNVSQKVTRAYNLSEEDLKFFDEVYERMMKTIKKAE
ncbi:helix-turn-helix transcriptional regulator [Ammoniphilus sp. CFH 90114]|uniref:helix-turn-helix domain-containing protein n=1 Tax=Ammoniphilus sp. CFH 90114 TaxID=2493665 RepID=UPI0013E9681F|nr:helix-turn-helix transcriptional regulator [Ammoniphilus sp. CFH 90114]